MRGLLFALLGHAALSACSIDAGANPGARCDEVRFCPVQQVCYRGFCVHGHDVPAVELDASLAPATGSDPSAPATNASSNEAGAPATNAAANATSLEAGMQSAPATQPPAVPSGTGASDAGEPSTVVAPPPVDAAVSPPMQVSTPPVAVTPATPSTPAAPVDPPVPQPTVTPPTEPVATPPVPSVPVAPPVQTPATPPATDDRGDAKTDSPLLGCWPLCGSRSVLCLVCLSGNLGSAQDNCDERERRANRSVREMCDFLCSTFRCDQ